MTSVVDQKLKIRWIHFSSVDLSQGLGGVEVYARSTHRELLKLGVDSQISKDPELLSRLPLDRPVVIQTHGSAPLTRRQSRQVKEQGAIVLHTLHGSSWERMKACGEWTWIGGYLAEMRERMGVQRADGVIAVHSKIPGLICAQKNQKPHVVSSNGWDSWQETPATDGPSPLNRPYVIYVGRHQDAVKDFGKFLKWKERYPEKTAVVVPGDSTCAQLSNCVVTGPLEPEKVRQWVAHAEALLLCSRYEGLPLVVLESLALGTRVRVTRVGGLQELMSGSSALSRLQGLEEWSDQPITPGHEGARLQRSQQNQKALLRWSQVAASNLKLAQSILERSK